MRARGREPFISEVELRRDRVPSFDAYPFDLPAVRGLRRLRLHPAVTFFVGENGSGKSTLLEAIAVAAGFNAEGGSKNFNFATRNTESELHHHIKLVRGTQRERGKRRELRARHSVWLEAENSDGKGCGQDDTDPDPGGYAVALHQC